MPLALLAVQVKVKNSRAQCAAPVCSIVAGVFFRVTSCSEIDANGSAGIGDGLLGGRAAGIVVILAGHSGKDTVIDLTQGQIPQGRVVCAVGIHQQKPGVAGTLKIETVTRAASIPIKAPAGRIVWQHLFSLFDA